MLKLFINSAVVVGCLTVAGCAQLQLGASDQTNQEPEQKVTVPVEATVQERAVPLLLSGSRESFDSGVKLLRDGRLDAAQMLFEKLARTQPELAGPWINLGHIHLARGDQTQAEVALRQALGANPNNCDALNQLGVMARRDGRFEEAEKLYRHCIVVDPAYVSARLNLAILYELYMGRLGEALAAYNEYQLMLSEPDSQVGGWVMDLQRRVAAVATR